MSESTPPTAPTAPEDPELQAAPVTASEATRAGPEPTTQASPAPASDVLLSEPQAASTTETTPEGPRYGLRQVAVAIALFYVMLAGLDARGIYHWAKSRPVSARSTELKVAAESLWAATAAVGLEAPKLALETAFLEFQGAHALLYPKTYAELAARQAAKEAQRRAAPTVAVSRRAPPAATGLAAKTTHAAVLALQKPRRSGAAQRPKVLIIGDSIMVSVGPVIKKALGAKLAGDAVVKARIATGLARPDVYDWNAELRRSIAAASYDYVLLMLGTNDSQDFVVDGEILTYGTTAWVRTYTERIGAMMDLACGVDGGDQTKRVLWIGLPPMQSAAFNRKAVRINSWAQRQAAARGCVEYVSLDEALGDGKGGFASYLKIDRALEKVRMVDGIHITAKGGRLVADTVVDRLRRLARLQVAPLSR